MAFCFPQMWKSNHFWESDYFADWSNQKPCFLTFKITIFCHFKFSFKSSQILCSDNWLFYLYVNIHCNLAPRRIAFKTIKNFLIEKNTEINTLCQTIKVLFCFRTTTNRKELFWCSDTEDWRRRKLDWKEEKKGKERTKERKKHNQAQNIRRWERKSHWRIKIKRERKLQWKTLNTE